MKEFPVSPEPAEMWKESGIKKTTDQDIDRLVKLCNLNKYKKILDVGCGHGRLPRGFIRKEISVGKYVGFDIKDYERNISFPDNFEFVTKDIHNGRYNGRGKRIDESFSLSSLFVDKEFAPVFVPMTFDIIYLYSVFSHMITSEVEIYLREFYKMLNNTGKVFLTAWTEWDVGRAITENPSGYRRPWDESSLHCVLYDRNFFEKMIKSHGFTINYVEEEYEANGQNLYILGKG